LGIGKQLLEGWSGKGGLFAEVEANVVTVIWMLSSDAEQVGIQTRLPPVSRMLPCAGPCAMGIFSNWGEKILKDFKEMRKGLKTSVKSWIMVLGVLKWSRIFLGGFSHLGKKDRVAVWEAICRQVYSSAVDRYILMR